MRIFAFVLVLVVVSVGSAAEEDLKPHRLLLDAGVVAAADPAIEQSATETTAGVVHLPDRLRGQAVTTPKDGPAAAWSKTHVILLVSLFVSVEPTDKKPRAVHVGAQFRTIGSSAEQPIILDVHPETEFRPADTTGDVSLSVTPELKFGAPGAASLGIGGKASIETKWRPGVPKIVSGHGDATAFWRFEARQDWWPIGKLPMTMLLAVPKKTTEARLAVDVRVELADNLFSKSVAGRAAQIMTLVMN